MTRHTCCCISKLKAALIYLFSLVLCGCSTPQVIGKFQGLKHIQGAEKNLHIILVHGINKHDPGWSKDFHTKLANSLELVSDGKSDWANCIFIDGKGQLGDLSQCKGGDIPSTADGVLKSVTLKSSDGKTVTITEVTWSPITTALKQQLLDYDKESNLSKKRAWLNKSLREGLVDDGFSDALAYTGEAGERIRNVVRKAICYSMSGKLSGNDACDLGKDDHRFAFITHSLGSRVVFDALHVGEEEVIKAKNDKSLLLEFDAMKKASDKTVAIYMLANQLPLLEMAGVSVAADKESSAVGTKAFITGEAAVPVGGLIGRFHQDRKESLKKVFGMKAIAVPPVSIAAFSDPNDLLSYSLCKAGMDRLDDVQVADIWVSNAINFGLFANPLSAHRGYWESKEAFDLLVVGKVEDIKRTCGASASDGNPAK